MSGRTLDDMTQWGLDTLFNPAKRHMDEEKRRLQSTREEVGDSSGGKRIDLESGRVTIRKRDAAETDGTEPATDETATPEAATPEAATRETATPEAETPETDSPAGRRTEGRPAATTPEPKPKPKREMTPAAKRAAERRARLRD
jgi:hypothetical protein